MVYDIAAGYTLPQTTDPLTLLPIADPTATVNVSELVSAKLGLDPGKTYDEKAPVIDGTTVAFIGYDGKDDEVWTYDALTKSVDQVTSNEWDDSDVQIDGSLLVWVGYDVDRQQNANDTELYYTNLNDPLNTIYQLTNNTIADRAPSISGYNVVWQGLDRNDSDMEIYYTRLFSGMVPVNVSLECSS